MLELLKGLAGLVIVLFVVSVAFRSVWQLVVNFIRLIAALLGKTLGEAPKSPQVQLGVGVCSICNRQRPVYFIDEASRFKAPICEECTRLVK